MYGETPGISKPPLNQRLRVKGTHEFPVQWPVYSCKTTSKNKKETPLGKLWENSARIRILQCEIQINALLTVNRSVTTPTVSDIDFDLSILLSS